MKALVFSLALGALVLSAPPMTASAQMGDSFTANEARDARNQGNTVPLKDILRQLKRDYGGKYRDADLFNRDGRKVYEIRWMTPRGKLVRYIVDARTGKVLSMS